jgi:hypothetical protein
MVTGQNYSFNSSVDLRHNLLTNDQLYFPLRFIQLLRLLCAYTDKYPFTTNIVVQNFRSDFKVHWIYILQINLLQQLIRFSTNFYRVGLQFLFKENSSSSVTFSEKEFFLPQTTRTVPLSQTKSIIDISEIGDPRLQQNGNEVVPDWTISSKCNNFFDQSKSVNSTLNSNFFSLRKSVLKTTTISKLVIKTNFTKNYRSDKSDTDSSSLTIITSRPKSQFKKTILKKPQINGSDFKFFYQNQGFTRSRGKKFKPLFFQPSWKLSLNSLEHLENQKKRWCTNLSLHFNSLHYEKCFRVFDAQNFTVSGFNLHTQNPLRAVAEKMKIKHEYYGYLLEKKIKKQIKSPILAYNYKKKRHILNFSLKNDTYKPDYNEFKCLFEAVSRNWIFTIQKNPFGKITLLIY